MFTVYDSKSQPVTVAEESDMEAMIKYCGYRRAITDPIVEPEQEPSRAEVHSRRRHTAEE